MEQKQPNPIRDRFQKDKKIETDNLNKWTDQQKKDYIELLEKDNMTMLVFMFDVTKIFKVVAATITKIKERIAKTSGNHPLLGGILNDLNNIDQQIQKQNKGEKDGGVSKT
ncbi:hypothetical protein KY343_07275 [Candidatus Woesearchaeota archaeon]|nr:hypothetical protein [Candidatus Woesearchaeota archaeon]